VSGIDVDSKRDRKNRSRAFLAASISRNAAVPNLQVGGFNSPASQPRAPEVMGSVDTTIV
jgi:hypothetical protein